MADHFRPARFVRDVLGEKLRIPADVAGDRRAFVRDVGEEDPRAFLREAARGRFAEPARSAGDDRGFSFELAHIRIPSIRRGRSEEHTSELQSLMRISYAVFCLKKKTKNTFITPTTPHQPDTQLTILTNTITTQNN